MFGNRSYTISSSSFMSLFLILLVLVCSTSSWDLTHQGIQSNSISEFDEREVLLRNQRLPVCHSGTVCNYLQANARGIQQKRFCRCQGKTRCPTVWDPEDGHSVTQGSDQYKFCEEAPALPACERGVLAYTSRVGYSSETGDLLFTAETLHCACPGGAKYAPLDNNFQENLDGLDLVETTLTCEPLKTCEPQDTCKAVTSTSESFFVTSHCNCPRGHSCSTLSRRNAETINMGKGTIHLIKCH